MYRQLSNICSPRANQRRGASAGSKTPVDDNE
jgi:hypothetical protein